jgi:2-polyprenyl-3-methyl-5-hydroxy-6-metoxy-1,4-benzoquinol methylase
MIQFSDKKIEKSWVQNAKHWVNAIRNREIESRLQVTNSAIVSAILNTNPLKLLDIGCGEGWLARELSIRGIDVLGIDIVPQLINEAIRLGGGRFQVLPYKDLSQRAIKEKFDVAVCNFSLLGNESVVGIFRSVPDMLNNHGYFIVQTIHPVSGCGVGEYRNEWREGSWEGFSDSFINPPPWYFRTLKAWKDLYLENGFTICEIIEPLNPETKAFSSIIFVGKMKANPEI